MIPEKAIVVSVMLCSAVVVLVEACRYPEFVQSRGGERDWRGHLSDGVEKPTASLIYWVLFDGRMMRVVAPNISFQRRCMVKVTNRTYLAVQRSVAVTSDTAPRNRYVCIEFIRRSPTVLQLRISQLSSRLDPHLCAEVQLVLDDWPLVDHRYRWRPAVVNLGCHLAGGYDIHVYDRHSRRGVCDALDTETRVEAACGDKGVFHFRFRYDYCVPVGLGVRPDLLARCAASWTTSNDIFTVLVALDTGNENRFEAWCLRRPRRTIDHSFTAFLSRRLVCDRRPISELTDVLMVDMQQSTDWGTSLCEDDYEGCAWNHPAKCARPADCARSCSVCNNSTPSNCVFGGAVQGRWRSPDSATSLNVEGSSLVLSDVDESLRTTITRYQCVVWGRDSKSNVLPMFDDDHATEEHLVVTRPGNGCRPRYACVQLLYMAVDDQRPTVVYFRISASRPWPIYSSVECSSFRYVSVLSPFSEVDVHFTLLTSLLTNVTGRQNYVNCVAESLPVTARFLVHFIHEQQQQCFAQIDPQSADGDDYFQLILHGCRQVIDVLNARCRDRLILANESTILLITESQSLFVGLNNDSIFCWLFTNFSTFYLLTWADCDPLTSVERLHRGILQPVAVFVDEQTLTSSTLATTSSAAEQTSFLSPAGGEEVGRYGASNDSLAIYSNVRPTAPGAVISGLSSSSTLLATTAEPRWDNSRTTANGTNHNSPAQQSSVIVSKQASSQGHSDRSFATSFADVTNASTGPTVIVVRAMYIFLAPVILLANSASNN